MQRTLISITQVAVALAFALGVMATAQEKKEDPNGTWTWTTQGRQGGEPRKNTLKLKLVGDKLTGTLTAPARGGQTSDTTIENGKFKGNELSFSVTREFQENKFTTKYAGKISGDIIKGTIELPARGGGDPRKTEWEAKRVTEAAK